MGEKLKLVVCTKGKHCKKSGAKKILCALKDYIEKFGLEDEVCVKKSDCLGKCGRAPAMQVKPQNLVYGKIAPGDCKKIVKDLVKSDKSLKKLMIKR